MLEADSAQRKLKGNSFRLPPPPRGGLGRGERNHTLSLHVLQHNDPVVRRDALWLFNGGSGRLAADFG